ncbi:MAG: cadmium resistance transporter [Cyanobacteriota bacterium]|nr:cadmium resistance transporter [Cyanobacteriota bacterium]
MGGFLQAVVEATTAFSATNIDDLFLLMLLFTPSESSRRPWQVVCGQYLGIGVLVAVSLLSLLGRIALPEGLIGLLGLFPISLGLSQLGNTFSRDSFPLDTPSTPSAPSQDVTEETTLAGGVLAAIIGVASLTIANGSDNISVYMAMLANSDGLRLPVTLVTFALLTGLWCLLAWWLTKTPVLQEPLQRFQRDLAPLLLVGIGALVLGESHILRHPPLAMVALGCLGVMVISLIHQLRLLLDGKRLAGVSEP